MYNLLISKKRTYPKSEKKMDVRNQINSKTMEENL